MLGTMVKVGAGSNLAKTAALHTSHEIFYKVLVHRKRSSTNPLHQLLASLEVYPQRITGKMLFQSMAYT